MHVLVNLRLDYAQPPPDGLVLVFFRLLVLEAECAARPIAQGELGACYVAVGDVPQVDGAVRNTSLFTSFLARCQPKKHTKSSLRF